MCRRSLVLPLLVTLCVCAPACDSDTSLPTTPTAPNTTETFADTLTVNGAKTSQFTSTARGTMTATLTSVSPDTAVIGVGIGTWNGTACQIWQVSNKMTQGASMTEITVSGVGSLCLHVYDPGTLTAPVTYSIDVSHP